MALTVRYVRANAAQNLDGLTLANAMNINDALRAPSGNSEYRILNDGVHIVTGSITTSPTGLSVFSPAYFVGCSDISGLVYADHQVSGFRRRTDHMPKISFSGAVAYANANGAYVTIANVYVSGLNNTTLLNVTAANCNFHNCYIQNMSTGNSAQALATAFRCNVINCDLITSGIVNNGIALNLANSLNGMAYGCYLSAPSGVGVQINNPEAVIDCVFDTCRRGLRNASASAGDGYSFGNSFINCTEYCIGQRNSIVSHSGQMATANNFAYNSGPTTAVIDSNGVIDYSYSTGVFLTSFNNMSYNTLAASTGYGNFIPLSSPTGIMAATDVFVDVSGKDFRYSSRATGIYNRSQYANGAGATRLGNLIRTPRMM